MSNISTAQRIPISEAPEVGTPTYTFRVEIDENACTGCGICVIQCPSRILDMVAKEAAQASSPACRTACPASNDVRRAMNIVSEQGTFEQAWKTITKSNPFPAVTGRVCHHPCESQCNRNHLDAPVNVNQFERFIGDYGLSAGLSFEKETKKPAKGRVAVVGSGPSGMSCAYHLAKTGYQVTVFEANEKAGGMLRYGIPRYRLPDDVLDKELQRIIDLGVEVKCSSRLGKEIELDGLREEFDAVYLALGAQGVIPLGLEGEKAVNSYSALDFLKAVAERKNIDLGKKVTIIGGGNVAVDAARSALRQGAQSVTIVCLEQRCDMPAWDLEVEETLGEGIEIVNAYGVGNLITKGDRVTEVELKRCTSVFDSCGCFCPAYDEDDRTSITTDSLLIAIGQRPDMSKLTGINISQSGHVEVADAMNPVTSVPGVFAGGDAIAVKESGTVSGAIGTGQRGALAIDAYLQGKTVADHAAMDTFDNDIPADRYFKVLPRNDAAALSSADRLADPEKEVNLPLAADQVLDESKRCLACGTGKAAYTGPQCSEAFNIACHNCHNCVSVCPEHAVRFTYYTRRRNEENWD